MRIKKGFIMLLFWLFYSTLFGQVIPKDKIPSSVCRTFNAKFPESIQETWSKLYDGNYSVDFSNQNKHQSATFANNGKWIETKTKISIDNIPKAVVAAIVKEFKSFVVWDQLKVEQLNKHIKYDLKVSADRKTYHIEISRKGKIIKRIAFLSQC